jgi:hypothetical protein
MDIGNLHEIDWSETDEIEHENDECTGFWVTRGFVPGQAITARARILCPVCRANYHLTKGRYLAMAIENAFGIMGTEAQRLGRKLLKEEGK